MSDDIVRAWPGGTGDTKVGGNYAPGVWERGGVTYVCGSGGEGEGICVHSAASFLCVCDICSSPSPLYAPTPTPALSLLLRLPYPSRMLILPLRFTALLP